MLPLQASQSPTSTSSLYSLLLLVSWVQKSFDLLWLKLHWLYQLFTTAYLIHIITFLLNKWKSRSPLLIIPSLYPHLICHIYFYHTYPTKTSKSSNSYLLPLLHLQEYCCGWCVWGKQNSYTKQKHTHKHANCLHWKPTNTSGCSQCCPVTILYFPSLLIHMTVSHLLIYVQIQTSFHYELWTLQFPWSQYCFCSPLLCDNSFFLFPHGCCLVIQWCPTLGGPKDCRLPGSSVHGIFQTRILEWVAISFSRRSSWPRDGTFISCISRWILYCWATREDLFLLLHKICSHLQSTSSFVTYLRISPAIYVCAIFLTLILFSGANTHRATNSVFLFPFQFLSSPSFISYLKQISSSQPHPNHSCQGYQWSQHC